jgi:hypothetical protein
MQAALTLHLIISIQENFVQSGEHDSSGLGRNDWLRTATAFLLNSRSSFYVLSAVLDFADKLYKWLLRKVTPKERPMNDSVLLLSHQWSAAN